MLLVCVQMVRVGFDVVVGVMASDDERGKNRQRVEHESGSGFAGKERKGDKLIHI
jgi:hypothetical protein